MTTPSQRNISPQAKEVGKELLNLEAVQINVEEPFTWVSGIQSPIYCDNRKIASDVKARKEIVKFFKNLIESKFPEVDIIAGVATGGIPMGILIADAMNLPFIYVRQEPKKHGLMKQVEGDFKRGDKIVLIEDHVSTGGSSLKAIKGLENEELELLSLISIMTYGFKSAEDLFLQEGIINYTLCDLDTIVDVSLNMGRISPQQKESILKFKENPENWINDQNPSDLL